ncbi:Ankyrin repeat-containing protein [Morus notabilis]|uniref:Ankyrin repeat-containing protein n=1 Tax=Morus notabilis TaxID=981085 RepID=W9RY12_9ROSA|nr:Ankyrin repeat-containing protein [Morus notabilis]
MDSTSSNHHDFNTFKQLYESVMRGEKDKVEDLYCKIPAQPTRPLTVSHDTVLHIAIYMERKDIARQILAKITNERDYRHLLTTRNSAGDTVLHEAAATGMTELAKEMLSLAPELLSINNRLGETPLFRAAHYGQAEMFNLLADQVDKKGPEFQKLHLSREDSTTILHITILAEFFGIPSENYPDDQNQEEVGGHEEKKEDVRINELGLIGKGWPVMNEIYNEKKRHESAFRLAKLLIKQDTSWEVSMSKEDRGKISVGNFDNPPESTDNDDEEGKKGRANKKRKAANLQKNTTLTDETGPTTDKLLQNTPPNPADMLDSSMEAVFSVLVQDESEDQKAPESKIVQKAEPGGGGLPNPMMTESTNTSNVESSTSTSTIDKTKGKKALSHSPPTSLLIATSRGIVEIVNEILRVYPQAVEHVSDMGQNILHVAIKYRQLDIFRRVKKMQLPMSRLVRRIDINGYTILHHVGVMNYYTGGTLPGPALQLQEELLWFERVRKIIPPHYEMHRSRFKDKSETAEEFFRRTHEKLLKEAQEWLKRTSESCSAVAVLIATVAFAAAYTVPGGSDQDTGVPVLLHDPFFLVFTVMDVLSLASSLTSVVMFLSILTSPFELRDFRLALPRKLIMAFTFLFFSVAVTMLAFAATIVLIIHLKNRWTTSIIYTVAFLPVTVFALLQFPLYLAFMDTVKSTLKVIKRAVHWYTIPRWFKSTLVSKND